MIAEIVVGPSNLTNGNQRIARGARDGAVVTQDAGPQYQETVRNGEMFIASTPAAGVTVSLYSAVINQFLFYNPANSRVNALIDLVTIGYVSGTMVAGHLCFGSSGSTLQASPGTLTGITATNAMVGGGATNACLVYSPGTVVTALTYLRPIQISQVAQTAAGTNAPWLGYEEVKGRIGVAPGALLSIAANVAAAVVATISIHWKEVPV